MEVNAQFVSFLTTLLIGLALGILFDFYRVMRGVFHIKSIFTFLCDTLFWIVALILTFSCLMLSNWAQLRMYVFFGIFGGWLLYYKTVGQTAVFLMIRTIKSFVFVLTYVKKLVDTCLLHPLGYLLGIFLYPLRRAGKAVRSLYPAKKTVSGEKDQE